MFQSLYRALTHFDIKMTRKGPLILAKFQSLYRALTHFDKDFSCSGKMIAQRFNPSIGLSLISTAVQVGKHLLACQFQSLYRALTHFDGAWSCLQRPKNVRFNPSIGLSLISTFGVEELGQQLSGFNPSIGLSLISTAWLYYSMGGWQILVFARGVFFGHVFCLKKSSNSMLYLANRLLEPCERLSSAPTAH